MVDARAAIAHLQFAIVCALSPALAAQLVRVAFGTKSSAAVPIVPVCANVAAENAVSVGYSDRSPLLVQLLPVINLEPAAGHKDAEQNHFL